MLNNTSTKIFLRHSSKIQSFPLRDTGEILNPLKNTSLRRAREPKSTPRDKEVTHSEVGQAVADDGEDEEKEKKRVLFRKEMRELSPRRVQSVYSYIAVHSSRRREKCVGTEACGSTGSRNIALRNTRRDLSFQYFFFFVYSREFFQYLPKWACYSFFVSIALGCCCLLFTLLKCT